MTLIKQIVIELKPFFVRLRLISLWENPGPGNAGAETLKAHVPKQLNVLFVAVIKINGLMVGVLFPRKDLVRHPPGGGSVSGRGHIHDA